MVELTARVSTVAQFGDVCKLNQADYASTGDDKNQYYYSQESKDQNTPAAGSKRNDQSQLLRLRHFQLQHEGNGHAENDQVDSDVDKICCQCLTPVLDASPLDIQIPYRGNWNALEI